MHKDEGDNNDVVAQGQQHCCCCCCCVVGCARMRVRVRMKVRVCKVLQFSSFLIYSSLSQ